MAIGANMTKREQALVAVAVLAIVALGTFWYFIYSPKAEVLDATAQHVDSLEAANRDAARALSTGSLQKLRDEGKQYSASLKVMRALVPTENEVPALLEGISTAARRVGLELSGVEPLPVLPGEQFDTYRYKMSVIGDYNAVGRFLSNVGGLDRIVAPVSLDMKPHPPGDKSKRPPPKDRSMLDTQFQVQTYVARTTPYVPPAPKK